MRKKGPTPEQIVTLLRQIEVGTSQGKSIAIACREAGISDQSFYRWRKEYGGLKIDHPVEYLGWISFLPGLNNPSNKTF